ncbi:OstA-like protein [Urechidicola croceus]|uniref:Organic solvent tolerance-like N-terminal domain-containing protein n=1 Tax=Urechidicola croceus TaxID=1850246 RepID=A0A1D8P563_9FLAO|nr:OstA-like protein [Urechidicola croceus]AOW19705.1 hypothetical protein LPB138_02975 [Urechidicola croceus]
MKKIFFLIFICISTVVFSQQKKKIKVLNADITYTDKINPELTISVGNVYVEIDGATIRCKRSEIHTKKNYLKAEGDVVINQGDTVIQTSKFADYDGDKKLATSWGEVVLKDPTMTLTTEKLYFDREKQHLYYNSKGTIKDSVNVLKSTTGNYYLETNKFQAKNNVVVTNPDQILETNHLDYYTDTGKAYLYDASTITGEESVIYTEKGYHDSKSKISHLTKNSWINYNDRLIEGDSLYYDETKNFSSATGNIKVTDTINDGVLKGGYGEFFRAKDSAFIIDRAVAISLIEKDSMHIHGDTLLLTGKPENRIVRAFHHVKFFKSDLQGKCDSLFSSEKNGITKMYRKPILWSDGNQITGDSIHFLSNKKTEELDSLKVLGNAFMIQKDSAGYNQTKGKNIFGKFKNNNLEVVEVNGNGEVIHFVRNEEKELIGITKMRCSNIGILFEDKKIQEIDFRISPDGKTYPEDEIHNNDRKLKGFIWREKEQPKDKTQIFNHDSGDEAIMIEERSKEREARLLAKKEAEEKRLKELKEQELLQQQDSIVPTLENDKLIELRPKETETIKKEDLKQKKEAIVKNKKVE